VRLGERRFGATAVGLLWAPRPHTVDADTLAPCLWDAPARVLALVPSLAALAPDRPARVGRVELHWAGLAEVLRLGPPPQADLSELVLRWGLDGEELGAWLAPRFALVHDAGAGRAWYGGRRLDLDRRPLVARLLGELAARPGRWVPRADLLVALWPDEFTSRGRLRADPVKLDRRLRQLASELNRLFTLADPPDLPAAPVENLRTCSDLDGGYRLGLPVERVISR
jgi:hypothetical protein